MLFCGVLSCCFLSCLVVAVCCRVFLSYPPFALSIVTIFVLPMVVVAVVSFPDEHDF